MILILLAVLMSAILYRMPRGGGLGVGKSTEGALIWAGVSALSFCAVFGAPWWLVPILALSWCWARRPVGRNGGRDR